jgi:phage antirepressor YoqD-like protein
MSEAAKLLCIKKWKNEVFSRDDIFELLRNNNILFSFENIPERKYIREWYFKVSRKELEKGREYLVTLSSQKWFGLIVDCIKKYLEKEIDKIRDDCSIGENRLELISQKFEEKQKKNYRTMAELAKLLWNYVDYVVDGLRRCSFLQKNEEPYQKYVNKGFFKLGIKNWECITLISDEWIEYIKRYIETSCKM